MAKEPPFTNREIVTFFERIDEKLGAIVEQTTKTNGRVNKLEDEVDEIKVKNENLGVKVGAGVFVMTTIVSLALTQLLK